MQPERSTRIINLSTSPSFPCTKSSCPTSCYILQSSRLFIQFCIVAKSRFLRVSPSAIRIPNRCATGRFPTWIFSRNSHFMGCNLVGNERYDLFNLSLLAGNSNYSFASQVTVHLCCSILLWRPGFATMTNFSTTTTRHQQ